MTTKWNYWILS